MNKKAIALLTIFLILVPLSLLVMGFFSKNMTEAKLIRKYIGGIRSFWAAEAGVAETIKNLRSCVYEGECTVAGAIVYENNTYQYNTTITHLDGKYYRIDSTGAGIESTKKVATVIQLREVYPSKFENAIETQGDIETSGSACINPEGSAKPFSALDFEKLFGVAKEEVKMHADYQYVNPPNNVQPCDGITWVELSEDNQFRITDHNWRGKGILVIDGDAVIDVDATITGGKFDGIIYITGELEIPAGNPVLSGTVLVEDSVTDVTKLLGNLEINYDPAKIEEALNLLSFISPHRVAWWEQNN